MRPWLGHVAWLSGLLEGGCAWRPDELAPEEWRGVGLYRAAERRVQERFERCPGCGGAKRRGERGHCCGWQPRERPDR